MKLYRWTFVFALLGLVVSLGWAQTAAPVKTVVLRAGRMLDVKSGKTLTGQTIVIQGDKIATVGAAAQVPADATVIDLPNATILPGLIDAHTHITFTPAANARATFFRAAGITSFPLAINSGGVPIFSAFSKNQSMR